MITIIDSGGANIASVQFALERLNVNSILTSDADIIREAERVILPGVGAAPVAMNILSEAGLIDVILGLTQPVLGVCLGMQLLFDRSPEKADVADADTMFEAVLEAGADNVETDDNGHEITCAPENFNNVREELEGRFGAPEESGLTWKPQNTITVDEAQASTLLKLLDALDDNDDVQNVSSNFDISDDIIAKLT